MGKWLVRIGYLLILISLISITPLGDYFINFLPLIDELWFTFTNDSEKLHYTYYKVVPDQGLSYYFILPFCFGVIFLVLGKYLKKI